MRYIKTIIQVFKLTFQKFTSSPKFYALPLLALVLFLRKIFIMNSNISNIIRTQLSEFLNKVDSGIISKVLIKKNKLYFLDKDNVLYKTNHTFFPKSDLFDRLMKKNIQFETLSSSFNLSKFLFALIFSAIITFLWSYFFSDVFPLWNKKPQLKRNQQATFKDIVGLEDSKTALKQVIQFMKNPQVFREVGARMRKGIVFYGPPGTGKTSLAKACAGQANVPFFSCNAAQFKQIYVGMGAKKVRQLFKKARQSAPSIIYIDQIDAMGNRSGGFYQSFDGASSQKNTTINQLLSQMDGFSSSQQVLVIGSTNKLELLDQALLRAGRFDLKIKIPLPNQLDRYDIFLHYLQNKKHKLSSQFIKQTVSKLKGWSGADIQNLANQSIYAALRRKSQYIQDEDIEKTLKVLL